MKQGIKNIVLLVCIFISFSFFAVGQETADVADQGYSFFEYIYGILYSMGPILLLIIFFIFFYRKFQKGQTQYFSKILPEYTKKHMEHMDKLIERLDKLIAILDKKQI